MCCVCWRGCCPRARWALERGITTGTSSTQFSPEASCTRAQVVTFLWRALGKPQPTGVCPFTDVSASQYYHDAVRTNNGCCASSANWLNYILKGDYDEVGFISTMQASGGGHVYNYIKQDGWYYFADLTIWHAGQNANATETGNMDNYYHSNSIHGNVHRAVSMKAFVQYLVDADEYMTADLAYTYVAEND